ncbi:MAG: glycosyltransferase family 2 protein [Hyphomonas sp.]
MMAEPTTLTHAASPARPTLSVIVTNFNYARYLPVAIDSALGQSEPVQVIVVDDFSTDTSRDVIAAYGSRIEAVLQPENRGHGAGFNAGFARATGDLVMFLDADDFLLPDAAQRVLDNYDPAAAAYFFRMRYTDETGALAGYYPSLGVPFSSGDLAPLLCARGRFNGTITSGLVFSRRALAEVMPMDAEKFRQGGDGYLSTVAPLYGPVRAFDAPLSAYRIHGAQHSSPGADNLARRARWRISHDIARYDALRAHAARRSLTVAEDLGEHDALHIKERLISLMFEPSNHPVPDDTVAALLIRSRRITLAQQGGLYRYLRAGWWTLLLALPDGARRKLFLYEISPNTRPAWFTKTVRALKRGR